MTAIETFYNGHKFRSRLEARWAVFFDEMEIEWRYEPEGYRFSDNTLYLPDFYLPDMNTFFEVKGVMTPFDRHKIELMIEESNRPVVVGYDDFIFRACDEYDGKYELTSIDSSVLVRCNKCGEWYFCGENGSWKCRCCEANDGNSHIGDVITNYDMPTLEAVKKSQQARFDGKD